MATPKTYYRIHDPAQREVESLLSEGQVSRVWIGQVYRTCDACGGMGGDEDSGCGRCGDRGEVEDVRRGVSVCRSLRTLARYIVEHSAYTDGCVVVALEGAPSKDEDWDAEDGAVLVHPTRIVSVAEYDGSRLAAMVAELEAAE